ncbi:rhodanese-like domain-containing protein [Acidobacteriota bacterium]
MEVTNGIKEKISQIRIKEVLFILVVAILAGCIFNLTSKNGIAFLSPSKAALYSQKNIKTLTAEETKKKIDQGGFILLDARDEIDFDKHHLPGALSFPVKRFELFYKRMKKNLPRDADIIVYCQRTECGASLHLAEELIKLKYENVEVFLGGFDAWEKAGYPSE